MNENKYAIRGLNILPVAVNIVMTTISYLNEGAFSKVQQ